jgi:hypothetical protein
MTTSASRPKEPLPEAGRSMSPFTSARGCSESSKLFAGEGIATDIPTPESLRAIALI